MWRTLSTANIKGIGKTVTLAQALFSLLGYTFFGFTTVPVTKTIRLSEWVTPGDTAIPGMTSLKDGDLQHSSALAQSPKEI